MHAAYLFYAGVPADEVNIKTRDNVEIHGWLLKRPDAQKAPTFISFPGNYGCALAFLVFLFRTPRFSHLVYLRMYPYFCRFFFRSVCLMFTSIWSHDCIIWAAALSTLAHDFSWHYIRFLLRLSIGVFLTLPCSSLCNLHFSSSSFLHRRLA